MDTLGGSDSGTRIRVSARQKLSKRSVRQSRKNALALRNGTLKPANALDNATSAARTELSSTRFFAGVSAFRAGVDIMKQRDSHGGLMIHSPQW